MPSTIGKCKLFRIKHITLLEGETFLRNKHVIAFFEIKCTFFGRKENIIKEILPCNTFFLDCWLRLFKRPVMASVVCIYVWYWSIKKGGFQYLIWLLAIFFFFSLLLNDISSILLLSLGLLFKWNSIEIKLIQPYQPPSCHSIQMNCTRDFRK